MARLKNKSAFDDALSQPLIKSEFSAASNSKVTASNKPSSFSFRERGVLPSRNFKFSSKSKDSEFQDLRLQYEMTERQSKPFQAVNNRINQGYHGEEEPDSREVVEEQILKRFNATNLDSELARERAQEISTINGDMRQIKDIYQDLSNIVDSQQTDINDIEMNAIETKAKAANGIDELEKASSLAQASRRLSKPCFISLAMLVVFVTLYIIFGLK